MTINKKNKPTVPINYEQLFEDLLRKKAIEDKYIKPYIKEIEFLEENSKLPSFRFRLEDLDEDNLFILMKKNIDEFLNYFREGLIKILYFNPYIKEFIEETGFEAKELNIILDDENFDIIPQVNDFSKSWSKYLRKLIKIKACYMTLGLDKKEYSKNITYFCEEHGNERLKYYPYGTKISIFEKPIGCFHPRCKNKELTPINEDDYTIGTFTICEHEFKAKQEFKTCYIFRDVDYFINKIHEINLSEEVEILGILRKDSTKLGRRDEIADYYVDVIEIKILKEQKIDEKIIKIIQEKIKKNPSYVEMLIDSVHPLTFLVDIFFPIKFLIACSFITGGSWRNKRDTLNSLIAGSKESFKSSIQKRFIDKVGKRNMFRQEVGNKGITHAGLFGTTERNSKNSTPDIRYGVQTLYSHGTLIYDEFQNLDSKILDDLIKLTENGSYNITQDGVDIQCKNKGSLILSQNLMLNEKDGSNNEEFDLETNLGWDKKNIGARLDRIDLVYLCPKQDTFTELIINKNETRETNGKIEEEISKILELEDFEFPKKITEFKQKIDYLHFNYFHNAKHLYRSSTHSKEVIEALDKFYTQMLRAKENFYETEHIFGIRGKGTIKRFLRVLSSLFFKEEVSLEEYTYLTDNCLKYILRFKDSNLITNGYPDKTEVFRNVFKFEIIDQNIQKTDIKEFLNHMKAYIKRTHFEMISIEAFELKMEKYLGKGYDLSNYNLKKLLKNNSAWLEMHGYKKISKRGKGNLTIIEKVLDDSEEIVNSKETPRYFKRSDILNRLEYSKFNEVQEQQKVLEIYELIRNIFSENQDDALEYKGVQQALSTLASPISNSLLNNILNYLIEIEFLVQNGKGFCNLNK